MNKIENILNQMTIEEKAGQLFFCCHVPTEGYNLAKEIQPGGIIFFSEDFKDKTQDQVKEMIKRFQNSCKIPMLMGVDEEGGTVVRMSRWPLLCNDRFKSPQQLIAQGGLNATVQDATEKSRFLKEFGINVNLAPVADVSSNEQSFIYPRTAGGGHEHTAQYVKGVVSAMIEEKIGQAIKHFPGYSDNLDTHKELAVDKRPLSAFEEGDLLPFIAGIEMGCHSIMVTHNIVECFDATMPASLSRAVHDYIRSVLKYDGVIMTDELYMQAIQKFCKGEDPSVLALIAGNDLIMTDHPERGVAPIVQAVRDGKYPIDRLDTSVRRILLWKQTLGLI